MFLPLIERQLTLLQNRGHIPIQRDVSSAFGVSTPAARMVINMVVANASAAGVRSVDLHTVVYRKHFCNDFDQWGRRGLPNPAFSIDE